MHKINLGCQLYNSSAVAERGDRLAAIDTGRKVGVLCPFPLGEAGSPQHNVACAEAYMRTKWYPDPSSRLATIDMCRKVEGVLCPFREEGVGTHLTQCCLDRSLSPYQVTS